MVNLVANVEVSGKMDEILYPYIKKLKTAMNSQLEGSRIFPEPIKIPLIPTLPSGLYTNATSLEAIKLWKKRVSL